MKKRKLKEIEKLEYHYLNKYYHFLKFVEDELLFGFKTKEDIKDDWFGHYKSGISDFVVGAERIVYNLLNGKENKMDKSITETYKNYNILSALVLREFFQARLKMVNQIKHLRV